MNSPQIERGYLRIASGSEDNDILLALIKANLNGTEYQIMLFVIRKTWGYNKKDDWISLSQFQESTGKSRKHIIKAISGLVTKRLLVKKNILGKTTTYSPNKDFTLWSTLVTKSTPVTKRLQTSVLSDTRLVTKRLPTKDIYTKDNTTKDIATKVANLNEFMDMFKEVNPNHERLFGNKTQRASLERMITKFGVEKMTNLLTQLPSILSRPYAPQISTPTELETKMGKLIQFYNQEKLKIAKNGATKI
jgi:phage replication O-like protein O